LGWLTLLAAAVPAWAQYDQPPGPTDEEAAAAGCAMCGGCWLTAVCFVFALVALNIVLMIWVVRDAKNRGMDTPVLWLLIILLVGPIGFIIYFFARPGGELVRCPHCQNKRLQVSAKCPHCGNA
jgi:hypothetical protein